MTTDLGTRLQALLTVMVRCPNKSVWDGVKFIHTTETYGQCSLCDEKMEVPLLLTLGLAEHCPCVIKIESTIISEINLCSGCWNESWEEHKVHPNCSRCVGQVALVPNAEGLLIGTVLRWVQSHADDWVFTYEDDEYTLSLGWQHDTGMKGTTVQNGEGSTPEEACLAVLEDAK